MYQGTLSSNANPWGFVGGRRRFQAQRQRERAIRRHEVARLLASGMSQSAIAAQLQVHKSVICRDVQAIAGFITHEKCPYCKKHFANMFGWPSPQCGAVGRPRRKRRALFWAAAE